MKTILHVLTRSDDALARAVLENQRAQAGWEVELVDLTCPEPDYDALIERVFAADSVAVW